MVLAGQFLERSVTVASGGLSLDALYHRGTRGPACAIAGPHPALGGSMLVPAIAELAWALTRAGHPTLRFDYRGVGASQGQSRHRVDPLQGLRLITPALVADELEDLLAAADQLHASTRAAGQAAGQADPAEQRAQGDAAAERAAGQGAAGEQMGLCSVGYSFGACVTLAAAADPRWEKLVLIAPPTRVADLSALSNLDKPTLIICAQHDPLCDRALLAELLAPLGELVRLEVVPHADHAFRRGLVELGRMVANWLRAGRPPLTRSRAPEEEVEREIAIELTLEESDEPPLDLDEG